MRISISAVQHVQKVQNSTILSSTNSGSSTAYPKRIEALFALFLLRAYFGSKLLSTRTLKVTAGKKAFNDSVILSKHQISEFFKVYKLANDVIVAIIFT